ncbi:MAG: STM4011 family radical SAM protein [Eubacteriales bacterium]|nr:STM4011 family radical SAM protein [Eubacteriales bacterium]
MNHRKPGQQIYYRGSLKSCNYSCSYCPFSKHKITRKQLERDQMELQQFVRRIREYHKPLAVLIVPYGEALVHAYYWEALGIMSQMRHVDAVGCQTNLSFPVDQMLERYRQNGGELDKLRLWCTFHPSMTTCDDFLAQCHRLHRAGIRFSAGAVGDPANLSRIQQVRDGLPGEIYLWINRMDGLGRPYTQSEKKAFLRLDPCFDLELSHVPADIRHCGGQIFVHPDGHVSRCNLTQEYEICNKRECQCFLAYCNRSDIYGLRVFGSYPAFRIPDDSMFGVETNDDWKFIK